MSNRATCFGILLTMLIMSSIGSVSIAQETPYPPSSINSAIAADYEADCRLLSDYQKLFTNHVNSSKETVNDIKQTINDIAADRGCVGSPQSNSDDSNKLKVDK